MGRVCNGSAHLFYGILIQNQRAQNTISVYPERDQKMDGAASKLVSDSPHGLQYF